MRLSSADALDCWQALRRLTKVTKHWPVIVVLEDGDVLELSEPAITTECLHDAERQYAEMVEWATKKSEPLPDVGVAIGALIGAPALAFGEVLARIASAPKVSTPPDSEPMSRGRREQGLHLPDGEKRVVALVAVEESWQVPARLFMAWGFFAQSQLVSHLRWLGERFGVELIGSSRDLVHLSVTQCAEFERFLLPRLTRTSTTNISGDMTINIGHARTELRAAWESE